MAEDIRLPIKIVVPREEDVRRPEHGGGGGAKMFGDVTPEVRDALDDQVGRVDRYFQSAFTRSPGIPAVARVVLKSKALAKSHRPAEVFNKRTCPIIGIGRLGELFISARPSGLLTLSHRLKRLSSKVGVANISTIREIAPYTAEDALGTLGRERIVKRIGSGVTSLKFRLFRHHSAALDDALLRAFLEHANALGCPRPETVHYASGLRIFRINRVGADAVEPLARFIGTQSLSVFPSYRIHRTQSRALGPLPMDGLPPPTNDDDHPTVGIVDTGIEPDHPGLHPWIAGREDYIADGDRDHDHGTFVAGLAVHAQGFNDHPRFPDMASRLLDVQAMPAGGSMTEDQLLTILEEVLPKHPEVRVWNLSLNRDEPCEDQEFSDIAVALDELQDRYGVTFVIAAGNYNNTPLRGWPPDDLGEDDRIAPPADSVRALAVGSLAHLDRPSTKVRREEPSPFSRRGPGPVSLPKPEVVHYGGNCDAGGTFVQTGVMSTNAQGELAENIGTSFAAPMVATLLANVENALLAPASRNLMKALLIHSAVFGSSATPAEELRYRGFGVPGDLASVLTCSPWAATLIFETELVPGLEFERCPFPFPPCLRNSTGAVFGEVLMTAVYEPPLDPTFGAEYCRANVDVSLGTYDIGKDGKHHHSRKIPPEPKDINRLYEKELIQHGFKWSPVKVYRRHIKRGVAGQDWRLRVTVNHRCEFVSNEPQEFALVITIRDPEQKKPVYDEVVAQMQRIGWTTVDLQIHGRVRTRT